MISTLPVASQSNILAIWSTLALRQRHSAKKKKKKKKYKMEDKKEWEAVDKSLNLFPVHQQQRVTMTERGEKIKGILTLSRVIREGCKRLPLISPDRNKPSPSTAHSQRQKKPKDTQRYTNAPTHAHRHFRPSNHYMYTHTHTPNTYCTWNISAGIKEHSFKLSKQTNFFFSSKYATDMWPGVPSKEAGDD